jgi:hypothetical protein
MEENMTIELVAAEAHQINKWIIECRMNIEANFIQLAGLLKRVRDEKLYVVLDHKTFESYIADPDLAMSRSKAYKLIRTWELYVEKLSIPKQILIDIGSKRLEIISPLVPAMILEEHHREDWLNKARELSRSDLENEVRQCQGKSILSSLPMTIPTVDNLSDLLKYKSYTEYVEAQPCILCGVSPVDKSHFPKTRGAGAPDDWIIPTCRNCHTGYHLNPLKWMHDYQDKWAAYFYGLILKMWEKT